MTQKIQLIIFSAADPGWNILLFQRADNGTWQPVTGGMEEGESVERAAARESAEETGTVSPLRVIHNVHQFAFTNPPGHRRAGQVEETVLAYEVPPDFQPVLSEEHTDARWYSADKALQVLPTADQRLALEKLLAILRKER